VTINISGIPVEIFKKNIKNLNLRVKPPEGRVTVSVPRSMSNAEIERFVRSRAAWIEAQVAKCRALPPRSSREYAAGETLYVFGAPHHLQAAPGSKNSLNLADGKAFLTLRPESTAQQRESFVREWYRTLLKAEITRLLPKWERITKLTASSWQIKDMSTRWGSCNTRTGKIWLNLQLSKAPLPCLEYVILHELLHLVEPGHNKNFYALMDNFMPEWKNLKAELNGQ